MRSSDAAVVSPAALAELYETLGNEALSIVSTCLRDLGSEKHRLLTSFGSGDWATCRRSAHKVVGLAGIVGAEALQRNAAAVEMGDTEARTLDALIQAIGNVEDALRRVGSDGRL